MKYEPPKMPPWLEELVPFRRYALGVENHRIHVMEHGTGHPVLCVHGNPTWGFLYRKVARQLAREGFRVIMPDLVGLGFSTRPRKATAHTLDNHARWMATVIKQLELENWGLVVHDWGGVIGLLAASRAEVAPSGIVLTNTVIGPPRDDFKPTAFHAFAHTPVVSDVAFRMLGFPQNALFAAQGDWSSIKGQVARGYRYPLRDLRRNAGPLALARMVPDSMSHPSIEPMTRARQWLLDFEGRVGAVWGEEDPILGTVVRYIERILPQARVIHTNGGHFLQEEVPEPIADMVKYAMLDVTAPG